MFWLGAERANWLGKVDVELFVSHRILAKRKTFPRASAAWALDSGGFTELSLFGGWQTDAASYAAAIDRYADEVGRLAWAAPQDWMCEPFMLERTGKGVADHQRLTVDNYLELRDLGAPVIPVLQGWTLSDYLACIDLYADAGVDLADADLVGLGSVCRRYSTNHIGAIASRLALEGLALHGFGVKTSALASFGWAFASADSMAWSFAGRYITPCTHAPERRKNCAHCVEHALAWRDSVLARVSDSQPFQLTLGIDA